MSVRRRSPSGPDRCSAAWAATLVALLALLTGCAAPRDSGPLTRFEFSQPQMGVPFRIVLHAPDAESARRAADAAFARVAELNARMSDYDYDSELSALSRTGGSGADVPVSPDLWFVLERAQRLARRTDGAFDVTVGPMSGLWRNARRERRLPDPARLAKARESVGHQWLILDPRRRAARLERPGMRLDLGGIAKGLAADEALAVLRRHGFPRAMVAAAGDITVGAPPPGESGWRVSVAAPDSPEAPPPVHLLLRDAAVATSGDVFQHIEINGVRYSHIVDPRTGLGLTDRSLVTVIARDGLTADSLATAASVLGPEAGLRLIGRTPGAAGHVLWPLGDSIRESATAGFDRLPRVRF